MLKISLLFKKFTNFKGKYIVYRKTEWSGSLLYVQLNLDHMIKVSEYEINIRVSDLLDNLHSFFKFYKNSYTTRIIIRTYTTKK